MISWAEFRPTLTKAAYMNMVERLNRIEHITSASISTTESHLHYPLYVTIFMYERKGNTERYGYKIKRHAPVQAEDCFVGRKPDTSSGLLGEVYREAVQELVNDYGLDRQFLKLKLREGLK